jgi:hypothetical protein
MAALSKRPKRDTSFEATVNTLYSSQHKGSALSLAAEDRVKTIPKMSHYVSRMLNHAPPEEVDHFKKHWSETPGKFEIYIIQEHKFGCLSINNTKILYCCCIVLHVTGTKGKGSCCAFIESILMCHR